MSTGNKGSVRDLSGAEWATHVTAETVQGRDVFTHQFKIRAESQSPDYSAILP